MTAFKTIIHEIARPCKELDHLVSHFWHSRWKQGVQNYFCYYSTANTNCELAFAFSPKNAHQRNKVFASFQGPTATNSQIETGDFSEMFGFSLYAHAAPLIFGVPVTQLANQLMDIKELDAEDLHHQLARCVDFTECISVTTNYLKAKINNAASQDLVMLHAIEKIRARRGRVDIRSLATELSLSQKQFERRFKEFSSFNPKLYARIIRFENALSPRNNSDSFTDIALELGYYDQAHFTNEFRKFSGFSPRKYSLITSY